MAQHHVVVDGSNLATEGRTAPNLTQLEEAVVAYQEEHPEASIIVVVDATFEHRIDAKERPRLKEAELHGEVVAPPAGTIGRGDVFILKIADRQGAVVLSNDSFQEFHSEYPWLFDEGRLVGGKPVRGVGWIFTERTPVRGPKKRASGQGREMEPTSTKKLAVARPDGSAPKVGDVLVPVSTARTPKVRAYDVARELGIETKTLQELAASLGIAIASHASSLAANDAAALRAAYNDKRVRAYELAKELDLSTKELKELAQTARISVASHSSVLSEAEANRIRAAKERPGVVDAVVAELEQEPAAKRTGRKKKATKKTASPKKAARRVENKDDGTPKAAKKATKSAKASSKKAKGSSIPSNKPLDLVEFLANHKVGSKVDGTVVSFTSHGAMVDVSLASKQVFHCYVETSNLGNPAPSRARDVVSKGETYKFKVTGIDRDRRVAELALAGSRR